jgi:hypothetical protein
MGRGKRQAIALSDVRDRRLPDNLQEVFDEGKHRRVRVPEQTAIDGDLRQAGAYQAGPENDSVIVTKGGEPFGFVVVDEPAAEVWLIDEETLDPRGTRYGFVGLDGESPDFRGATASLSQADGTPVGSARLYYGAGSVAVFNDTGSLCGYVSTKDIACEDNDDSDEELLLAAGVGLLLLVAAR